MVAVSRPARAMAALLALVALCGQTAKPVEDSVPLDVPVAHLYVRESDEAAMVAQVNALRRAHNQPALVLDMKLANIARDYGREMLTRRFFSHWDPDGRSFVDRLKAAKYPFDRAAENIAFNRDEGAAEASLEASPPHRHNMLEPTFTRVGIGVVADSVYGSVFVQEFAGD
jgi:uncharacterized protein YkwD